MAPFFVPTPCIIPLRLPVFGKNRNLDTKTKIELLCETDIPNIEIFYTLDGTKPQPYAGIVQGSKIKKYAGPFCLPSGKITVKSIAMHARIHSLCSNVITKCFHVDNAEPFSKLKTTKSLRKRKPVESFESEKKLHDEKHVVKVLNEEESEDPVSQAVAGNEILTENEIPHSKDRDTTFIIENIDLCDIKESRNEILESLEELIEEDFSVEDKEDSTGFKEISTLCDIMPSDHPHACSKCEMPLQHCFSCNKVNAVISRYCDKCGEKLIQECSYCKEHNPYIAIFCQYCGKKLDSKMDNRNAQNMSLLKLNQSVMAKPGVKDVSAQKSPIMRNRSIQTPQIINKRKTDPPLDIKKLPLYTPGRGYWRQQLDYICNHLKAHAYNDLDFRKLIGEPCLHHFLSADVIKDEDNIVVNIVFSSLTPEQLASAEKVPEDKN